MHKQYLNINKNEINFIAFNCLNSLHSAVYNNTIVFVMKHIVKVHITQN